LAVVEDGHEVLWQSNRDLGSVVHGGVKAGIHLPGTAEGGFVLVASTPRAITALATAEHGIRAAEGQL